MVFKAHNRLSFILSLALICVSVMSQTKTEELFLAKGIEVGVPRIPGDLPTLSFLIEGDLYQNPEFASVFDGNLKIDKPFHKMSDAKLIDCESLNNLLPDSEDSLYFMIESSSKHSVTSHICLNHGKGIKGVITINLDRLAELSETAKKNIIIANIAKIIKDDNIHATIKVGSLCTFGSYNLDSNSCEGSERNRRHLDAFDDYLLSVFTAILNVQSNNYVSTVIMFVQGMDAISSSFLHEMIVNMGTYVGNETQMYSGNAYNTSCQFQGVNIAINLLLMETNITQADIENLFSFLSYSLVAVPEDADCNSNSSDPYPAFSELIYFCENYLTYYHSSTVGITPDYEDTLNNVDQFLNKLMINYLQNGNAIIGTANSFESSTIATSTAKKITLNANLNAGPNVEACNCPTFCSSSSITILVKVQYANLGYFADPFSVNFYRTGTIVNNTNTGISEYSFYPVNDNQNPGAIVSNDCLNISESTKIYNPANGFACAQSQISGTCNSITTLGLNAFVNVNDFGLYEIYPVCNTEYAPY